MTGEVEEHVVRGLIGGFEAWREACGLRPDCCIAAGRLALDVCRFFDVPAEPHPVRVIAENPVMAKWREEHDGTGMPPELWEETGAWSVGVDPDQDRGGEGWNGHLVVVTSTLLVDLSAGQMTRPAKNLHLGPLSGTLPDGWMSEAWPWPWAAYHVNDCVVAYQRTPTNTAFRRAKDWGPRRQQRKAQTGELIRAIREAM
jgi:hypothetical protein